MSKLKTIYALNAVNMLTLTLSQIAVVPVLLHYLGIHGYEQWVFVFAVGAACAVLDIGMIIFSSNAVRIAFGLGDFQTAQKTIGYGLSFFILFFLFFGLAAAVTFETAGLDIRLALALIVLSVPFTQFRCWLSYILTARISQIWELGFFIGLTLLQTAAYVLVVMMGGGVAALACTFIGTTTFLGIVPLILALRRFTPEIKLAPRKIPKDELPTIIKGCISNFGYSASGISVTHLPVILLGLLPGLPSGSLAIFTTSRTLTGVVRQFCQQLARSNGIEISRYLAPEHKAQMQRIFLAGSATISLLAAAGMGGLLPVADLVLKIWTGKTELYSSTVINLFCITAMFSAQVQLPMILPQFTNKAHIMALPLFTQVCLITLLGAPAGYFFGSAGMVLILGLAELSTLGLVSLRQIIPAMDVSPSRFLFLSCVPSFIVFAVSFGISFISRWVFRPENFYGLAQTGVLWAAIALPLMTILYRAGKRYEWS